MTTAHRVAQIVTDAGGRSVVVGANAPLSTRIRLLEDDALIEECSPGTVVVLTAAASVPVRGFRFESLLARAASRGIGALVVATRSILVPARFDTAAQSVCTLSIDPENDLGALIADIARVLFVDDSMALLHARRGRAILEASASEAGFEEVADRLGDVLPGLARGPGAPDRLTVPSLDADADAGDAWSVPDRGEPFASIDALLLRSVVALTARSSVSEAPDRTLSTLITELLVSRSDDDGAVEARCRALGFDPESWHTVLAVTVHRAGEPATSTIDQLAVEERVRRTALRVARTQGATWRWARVSSTLLLICSWDRDPGPTGDDRARASAAAVFSTLAGISDEFRVACGLSRVHAGTVGLRLASAEARSSARLSPHAAQSSMTSFDEFGLDRALLDWFSLDESQDLSRRLLAPLRALPAEKAETLMLTLQSYLDNQGSVVATASALYLHRNAVAYRLTRIRRLLGTDLDDPEERLALQLACRGRHLLNR